MSIAAILLLVYGVSLLSGAFYVYTAISTWDEFTVVDVVIFFEIFIPVINATFLFTSLLFLIGLLDDIIIWRRKP